MGYYTAYNLVIYEDNRKEKPIKFNEDDPFGEELVEGNDPIVDLRNFSEGANFAINEDGEYNEDCKWYDHDEDMLRLSKEYPDIIFKLCGSGEENHDIWEKYYSDGKIQYCRGRIVYDEYDENKLITPKKGKFGLEY